VCKAGYGFPTVRQVTFKVPIDAGVDVGLFKRGSVQSGDQPMKPDLVLAPGQQHTFYPSQTMSLKENFAFRFMPVEDISCPGEGSISPDESKCLISCGTKKSASCRNAEKICKKYKNKCDTIALDKSSKNGYLKSIAIEWHSPMLLDLFLSSDLYQEYEITSHPNFNPLLPLKVPNMKIPKPEAWDEEEDGEWAPPLMDNTEKLKNNPRFIAYDKNTAGERAGQVAHKGGPIKKENKMRNTDDKNYNHNNNNEDIKANDDEQPGKKKKKQSSKSKRSSKSSEEL
jgi:hypothetical protein